MDDPDLQRTLGRIEGRLDAICERLDDMHEDVSAVRGNQSATAVAVARHGALWGVAAAVGVSLLAETIKRKIGLS
jgi:hypothetical protein